MKKLKSSLVNMVIVLTVINNYCKPKRFGEVAKKGGDK